MPLSRKSRVTIVMITFYLLAPIVCSGHAFLTCTARSGEIRYANLGSTSIYERIAQFAVPESTVITSLGINISDNNLDGPVVVTLRINQTPTAMTTSIAAGSVGVVILPGNISVGAGDLLSIELDGTSATTGYATTTFVLDMASASAQPQPQSVNAVTPTGMAVLIGLLMIAALFMFRR